MRARGKWTARLGAVALVGTVVGGPSATAAPPGPVDYVALGDSYAAGSGASDPAEQAYPVQVDGRMRIDLTDFAAVPGATTGSLLEGQLWALDGDADLVTVQVGGNDIGWFQVVAACLGGTDEQCAFALRVTTALVRTVLPALLDAVYEVIAVREPGAHVVVLGYPRLFTTDAGEPMLNASVAEQEAMNAGADLLNGVIAATAADHGFQFVDVTRRFLGHGANADEPWIHALGGVPFHPNDAGYEAYAAALTAAIKPGQLKRAG